MIAGHTKFYYLEVAGVSPQPAVGLALPRPGVVGVGDVPAPSVSALPSLVPAKRKWKKEFLSCELLTTTRTSFLLISDATSPRVILELVNFGKLILSLIRFLYARLSAVLFSVTRINTIILIKKAYIFLYEFSLIYKALFCSLSRKYPVTT